MQPVIACGASDDAAGADEIRSTSHAERGSQVTSSVQFVSTFPILNRFHDFFGVMTEFGEHFEGRHDIRGARIKL